jgi:lysozyme
MAINDEHKTKELIKKHEGVRLKPYRCTSGRLTIGAGRNLEDTGITEEEAMFLFGNDYDRVVRECSSEFSFFEKLNPARRAVIISMAFNMGTAGLSKFWKMAAAIECGDYITAAAEMINSKWSKQVGQRAIELAEMMKTGNF